MDDLPDTAKSEAEQRKVENRKHHRDEPVLARANQNGSEECRGIAGQSESMRRAIG